MPGAGPKWNSPARSKGRPFVRSSERSDWSNEPVIAGRPQLYSMKLMIEAWSLRLWSTWFVRAHGEMSEHRQPRPEAAAALLAGERLRGRLGAALARGRVRGGDRAFTVPVRFSAPACDGLSTPLYAWSYQPSESS